MTIRRHVRLLVALFVAALAIPAIAAGIELWDATNSKYVGWQIDGSTGAAKVKMVAGSDLGGGAVTATGGTTASTLAQRFGHILNVIDDYHATGDCSTDDWVAIQAALTAAGQTSASRRVRFPAPTTCYLISAPLTIPDGMTAGEIFGDNEYTSIQATPDFSGARMLVGAATLSILSLHDLQLNASNVSGITKVLDLTRTPESSINTYINRLRIIEVANGNTGIVMDGNEDSTVAGSQIAHHSGGHGTAISWSVPAGNLNIRDSTMFEKIVIDAQNAEISNSTIGEVSGVAGSLVLNNSYSYADTTDLANVNGTGAGIAGLTIIGGWFNPNGQNNVAALKGTFGPRNHNIIGPVFDMSGGPTGYSILKSTTVGGSATANFALTGYNLAGSATVGTPGTNATVSIATALPQGEFTVPATRDLTTASGTQTVSGFVDENGVSFTPRSCSGFGAVGGGAAGVSPYTVYNARSNITTESVQYENGTVSTEYATGFFFIVTNGAGAFQTAKITSFGAGSATLTWVKTSTPTGTFSFSLTCRAP